MLTKTCSPVCYDIKVFCWTAYFCLFCVFLTSWSWCSVRCTFTFVFTVKFVNYWFRCSVFSRRVLVKPLPFGSIYRVSGDTGTEFSHPEDGGRRFLHRCKDTDDRHLSCSFFFQLCTAQVGPCRHGITLPRVADGGTASNMEGSCGYIE
jgi:hypothetical protein